MTIGQPLRLIAHILIGAMAGAAAATTVLIAFVWYEPGNPYAAFLLVVVPYATVIGAIAGLAAWALTRVANAQHRRFTRRTDSKLRRGHGR